MKHKLKTVAISVFVGIMSNAVQANSYPNRPITMIVPFAPGGSADGIARVLAESLSSQMGQTVIVENRPGGGGSLGLVRLANVTPDGYTVAIAATGAIVVNPHLPDGGDLKPTTQLAPLAKIANIPLVLIANKKSGFKSVNDLIERAKQDPHAVSYGTPGQYTAQHLSGELLASMSNVSLTAVPYRGSIPAVTDVLGGQLSAALVDLTSAASHIKADKVVALGITAPERTQLAINIPTISESSGLQDYAATAWLGMFATAGTPTETVNRLSHELDIALKDKKVQERILTLSAEPAYMNSEDYKNLLKSESQQWKKLIESISVASSKTQK